VHLASLLAKILDNVGEQLPLRFDFMEIVQLFQPCFLDVFRSGTSRKQQTHNVKVLDLAPQFSADGGQHGKAMRSCLGDQNLIGVSFAIVGNILRRK
jgi:hypothetical protein